MGFFIRLQYTSMNSMAFADIERTIRAWPAHRQFAAADVDELRAGLRLADRGWYLGDLRNRSRGVTTALHYAFDLAA